MGCTGSKQGTHKPQTQKGPAAVRDDPKPQHEGKFWKEPVGEDSRVKLLNGDKQAEGTTGGSTYAFNKHNPGKTTRYWFKINPGKNSQADINIGVHHLTQQNGEDGSSQWYVDDAWMVNLKNGKTRKETYIYDMVYYNSNFIIDVLYYTKYNFFLPV